MRALSVIKDVLSVQEYLRFVLLATIIITCIVISAYKFAQMVILAMLPQKCVNSVILLAKPALVALI